MVDFLNILFLLLFVIWLYYSLTFVSNFSFKLNKNTKNFSFKLTLPQLYLCFSLIFLLVPFSSSITLLCFKVTKIQSNIHRALLSGIILNVCIFALFVVVKYVGKFDFFKSLNYKKYSFGKIWVSGAKYYFRCLPLIIVATFLWRGFLIFLQQKGYDIDLNSQDFINVLKGAELNYIDVILVFFTVCVLAPLGEEILFRGFIYRLFKNYFSTFFSLLLSSLIFALLHQNLASFFPLVMLGIFLGIAYERNGNIFVSVCFHSIFNAVTLTALLFLPQL